MSPDDSFTYNPLSNEDKELLFRHGYRPGELPSQEERELITDLRNQLDGDDDGDRRSTDVSDFERDGTE